MPASRSDRARRRQQSSFERAHLIDLVLMVRAHLSHGAQAGDMNRSIGAGQRSVVQHRRNRPNANYFLLAARPITDPTFNTLNLSPSPTRCRNSVQTGSYSREMGGAGGGQINIVTRSRQQSPVHGTAYDFLRNGAMDAYTFGAMGSSKFPRANKSGLLRGPSS